MGIENTPEVNTETEEISEDAEFRPEQALTQEKTILERFRGKATNVARTMLLVSTLSFGQGAVNEVYAQEDKVDTKIEKVGLILLLSKVGNEDLLSLVNLFSEDPSWVEKINENYKNKSTAVNTGNSKLWRKIIREEELQLQKMLAL